VRPLLFAAALSLTACGPSSHSPNGTSAGGKAAEVDAIPADLWNRFSGERALDEVRQQVEIGPRPSGSEGAEKARQHIESTLRRLGWMVERQTFEDRTPAGPRSFTNLIARFPGGSADELAASQRYIVASHYDTKRFTFFRFVGANDGGSSTGALLELARVAPVSRPFARRLELVFFDGEEALVGLHGSRRYAADLRDTGRAKQFRFGILWDMIGDKDLTVTLPSDSPKALVTAIFDSATKLGARQHFTYFHSPILDDHVPVNRIARIPMIDLIDFDFKPWHTAQDTPDKLSAASLQTIGQVTIDALVTDMKRNRQP
jgi:hypothetical protein